MADQQQQLEHLPVSVSTANSNDLERLTTSTTQPDAAAATVQELFNSTETTPAADFFTTSAPAYYALSPTPMGDVINASVESSSSITDDSGTGLEDKDYADALLAQDHAQNVQQDRQIAWTSVLLGAAIANVFVLVFLLGVTRGKRGYFGTRLYLHNLALFALIQIVVLAWSQPEDYFGLEAIFSAALRDFLNDYNASLLEWTQIVFLSSSTVLILDSIQRYRNNGLGLGKLKWTLTVLLLDLVPLVYILVKGSRFEFVALRPKPLAVYHAVVLGLFGLASTILNLTIVCVPLYRLCSSRQEQQLLRQDQGRAHALREKMFAHRHQTHSSAAGGTGPAPKPFTYAKLVCLGAFIVLAGWTQYTVFSLGADLQPGGLKEAKEFAQHLKKEDAVGLFLETLQKEKLVYILLSVQKWSCLARPFAETLFAILLVLLPSVGSKFQLRKVFPQQGASESGEEGQMGPAGQMAAIGAIPSAPPANDPNEDSRRNGGMMYARAHY